MAKLESRLGTDAPREANVLQRIIALEAGIDVTASGKYLDRIATLESKANESLNRDVVPWTDMLFGFSVLKSSYRNVKPVIKPYTVM